MNFLQKKERKKNNQEIWDISVVPNKQFYP